MGRIQIWLRENCEVILILTEGSAEADPITSQIAANVPIPEIELKTVYRFWAWPGAIDENEKWLQVRRLASQSASPDQMGVFVGSGPK